MNYTPHFGKATDVNKISVKHLAEKLNVKKNSVFKIMKKLNITGSLERSDERHGQHQKYLTEEEAKLVKDDWEYRQRQQENSVEKSEESSSFDWGYFYIIQPEPVMDAKRIKFGFAANVGQRLSHFKTVAPFATVTRQWKCRRSWEAIAMEVSSHNCTRHSPEVYHVENIEESIARCEKFFNSLSHLVG